MFARKLNVLALLACLAIVGCNKNEDTVEISKSENEKLQNLNKLTEKATKALAEADKKFKESEAMKKESDENLSRLESESQALNARIESENQALETRTKAAEQSEKQAQGTIAESIKRWEEVRVLEQSVAGSKAAVEALEAEVNNQKDQNALKESDLVSRESDLKLAQEQLAKQQEMLKIATKRALSGISANRSNFFRTINENKPYPFMIAVMGWTKAQVAKDIRAELDQLREKAPLGQVDVAQKAYLDQSKPEAIFNLNSAASVRLTDKYLVVMKGENVDKFLASIYAKDKSLRYAVEPIEKIAISHYITIQRTAENFWGTDGAASETIGPFVLNGRFTEIPYGASEIADLDFKRHWNFVFGQASGPSCKVIDADSLGLMSRAGIFDASWDAKHPNPAQAGKSVKQYLHTLFKEADDAFIKDGTTNANNLISGMKIETQFWLPVSIEDSATLQLPEVHTGQYDSNNTYSHVTVGSEKFVYEDGKVRYYRLPMSGSIYLAFSADKLERLTQVRAMKEALAQ